MGTYKIELQASLQSGALKTMWRLGRQFEVKKPQVLELTEDEVEVFKNDPRFKIKDSTDSSEEIESGEASESDSVPPSSDAGAEEAVDSEIETEEDSVASLEEEEASGYASASKIDQLLKDNSREQLDALANELGIEGTFANKTEVAQAIVKAQ